MPRSERGRTRSCDSTQLEPNDERPWRRAGGNSIFTARGDHQQHWIDVSPQDRVVIVRFGLAEGGVNLWYDVFLLGLAYVLLIQRVTGLPAMAACVPPPLATAMLGVLLAAMIETAAFLIIYGLSLILNGQRSPSQVAAIGFVVSASLALLVNFLVVWGISAYWSAFWPMGYLFWPGLPSLIFIGTTTWLCWREGVDRVSQQAKLTQAMIGR